MPLHFIVDFHCIYIKNVGFKGVGSVVRIETSRVFFVIRSVLHRCQAAQRKKSPICHPHLGNGLLQRFLLTIQTVDLSKSPWVCFHWVSIGGTLDVTTTPIFPYKQIGQKLRDYYLIQSWCFIDVGVFLSFFFAKKKNKESFSRRSSFLTSPPWFKKWCLINPPKKKSVGPVDLDPVESWHRGFGSCQRLSSAHPELGKRFRMWLLWDQKKNKTCLTCFFRWVREHPSRIC